VLDCGSLIVCCLLACLLDYCGATTDLGVTSFYLCCACCSARYNTVHLTGRLGSDPEPRYFDDGKVVVNLSLACRRKYHSTERKLRKIQSGEEETDWYGLEIWGQTAEFVAKYVDKGTRVGVIGQLQIDWWQDKETGEPRNRAKVVVRDLDVLETRAESELRRSGGGRRRSFDDDEDDYSPSKAGTGGFFDN